MLYSTHLLILSLFDVHRFLFAPASHSVKRCNQILVEVTISPAIFDRVQSLIEFAFKTKILLFMHNGLEPYLVLLTWRFKLSIFVVFLQEIVFFGIEFEFPEMWISCSVSPFVECCAMGSLICILFVVLF